MSDHPRISGSRLARSFLPSTAVLEMTYRCNHQCLFCSCPWEAGNGAFPRLPELTVEHWKPILQRLAAMGVTDFAFTGGEPLLKEGLVELLEHAAACETEQVVTEDGVLRSRVGPPKLYLLSNGTVVDRTVLDVCRRLPIQLSLSLPGLSTYREHTGAGDPDTVLQNFRAAAALGIATVAGITVTRLNLHELYQTIAAALLAGAGSVLLNRFLPGGRGLAHAHRLQLSWDETRQMLDVAEQALADAGRYGNVGTELPRCLIDDPSRYRHLEVGTRCAAAVRFFTIDPSGYVRVCNHSAVRLEPFDRIDAVKTHPYWLRFIRKDYLPAACGGCQARGDCDGGCREAAHLTGGLLDAPDPLGARVIRS
jgi:radical SAM protein with 4Fe4S-binding SPASM domain